MYSTVFDRERGYFEWLCDLIHVDQGDRSYRILAKELYSRDFYYFIPHDENRAQDGLDLRDEYLSECGLTEHYVDLGDCSVLEMMIGLARRMSFDTIDPYNGRQGDLTTYWFWEMVDNIGLMDYSDDCYESYGGDWQVDDILTRLLDRKYRRNGEGGLFPLRLSRGDQRKVELWYQASAYLAEQEAM